MKKYSVKYVFVLDNIIMEPLIIDAKDMVRACVIAEQRVEVDTGNTYRVISIKEVTNKKGVKL